MSMGVVKICKNKSLKPYFFIGAEAGPGKKNNPEPEKSSKNGPAPQLWPQPNRH